MNASSTHVADTATVPIQHLPLHLWHLAHGARMEPFAGWTMPIHYGLGVLGEHRHTRAHAGLFDVSHMGQVVVRSHTDDPLEAALALESLIPVDVVGLRHGRQRYGFLTDPGGGILDDLMIAREGNAFYLVVNAASAERDVEYLRTHLSARCTVERVTARGLLALQGPGAVAVLGALAPATSALRFLDVARVMIDGVEVWISRSGYTGEDGFELSVPESALEAVADRLLENAAVRLVGLGARDSLRLEAGLCLYGRDISTDTTPVEAGLEWAIAPVRRAGGARAGGFPGSDIVLPQLIHGAARRRVGLRPDGRPVRAGAELFAEHTSTLRLGEVTSGTFGPSAGVPVAMGYVPVAMATPGQRLVADIRGQRVPVTVTALPFVPHRYYR